MIVGQRESHEVGARASWQCRFEASGACVFLWFVQCAILGVVKWPREGYFWETLLLGILGGAFVLDALADGIAVGVKAIMSDRNIYIRKAGKRQGGE